MCHHASHIRLLQLTPDKDETAPIHCQLLDYPLCESPKGTHLCEALSYVWGSPSKPRLIYINGNGHLPVTENLYAAHVRLRDGFLPRLVVWIDAVCIHQGDIEERNHQVWMMAKIYAYATRVIVWLEQTPDESGYDRSATNTHQAFEILRSIAASPFQALGHGEAISSELVLAVLQHPGFRRIWALQEVAAACHVLTMCQTSEMDGHTFCHGAVLGAAVGLPGLDALC